MSVTPAAIFSRPPVAMVSLYSRQHDARALDRAEATQQEHVDDRRDVHRPDGVADPA